MLFVQRLSGPDDAMAAALAAQRCIAEQDFVKATTLGRPSKHQGQRPQNDGGCGQFEGDSLTVDF